MNRKDLHDLVDKLPESAFNEAFKTLGELREHWNQVDEYNHIPTKDRKSKPARLPANLMKKKTSSPFTIEE